MNIKIEQKIKANEYALQGYTYPTSQGKQQRTKNKQVMLLTSARISLDREVSLPREALSTEKCCVLRLKALSTTVPQNKQTHCALMMYSVQKN